MDRCRGSFTNWDVEIFKEREQLLPIKQPGSEYFIGFVISVAFAGVFGGLFVLLLMVVIVVTCCYYCRRDSD